MNALYSSSSYEYEDVNRIQTKLINSQNAKLAQSQKEETQLIPKNTHNKDNKFDLNVPVRKKILNMYFDKDDCIDEASCEHSLMSSSHHEMHDLNDYDTNKTPSKYIENEMPLDLSRISKLEFSTEKKNYQWDNDMYKTNEIKISDYNLKSPQKSLNYKHEEWEIDSPVSNHSEESFYKNEFINPSPAQNPVGKIMLQDPLEVLFGPKSSQKVSPKPSVNYVQAPSKSDEERNDKLGRILKTKYRAVVHKALTTWKTRCIWYKYEEKIQAAAKMVDKMSKFSRNFISVNSINAYAAKAVQKALMKKFLHWKYVVLADKLDAHNDKNSIEQYQRESEEKILLAYRESSQKLEMIEQKYSKENQMLREKLEQSLTELNVRASEIKKLKKQVKNLESWSQQVNEAICPKCNESLEDSQVFKQGDLKQLQSDQIRIQELENEIGNKTKEFDTLLAHLNEKHNNENIYKSELNKQSQTIILLEKDKHALMCEIKQLKTDKLKFIEQFKLLQQDFIMFKQKSPTWSLMIDAYTQIWPKLMTTQTQTESSSSDMVPIPQKKSASTNKAANSKSSKLPPKRVTKKPQSKLSFSRTSSSSSFVNSSQTADQKSPSESTETLDTNFHTNMADVGFYNDKEMLANELIVLNKEVNQLKYQLKKSKSLICRSSLKLDGRARSFSVFVDLTHNEEHIGSTQMKKYEKDCKAATDELFVCRSRYDELKEEYQSLMLTLSSGTVPLSI